MKKIILLTLLLLLIAPEIVIASIVPELPQDNLIQNPWFRSTQNNSQPGLDFWIDSTQDPYCFTMSQKDNNYDPSPDSSIPTSARWASGTGQGGSRPNCLGGIGGVDGKLYQIVSSDQNNNKLSFQFYYVTQYNEMSYATIYAGETETGPWIPIWVPWSTDIFGTSSFAQTNLYTKVLDIGYPFYKIEFTGRYPAGNNQGFKFTGVYFSTSYEEVNILYGDRDYDNDVDILDIELTTQNEIDIFSLNKSMLNFGVSN